MNESLLEEFDYDAWANRLWATALTDAKGVLGPESLIRLNSQGPWPDFFIGDAHVRAGEVFVHILWAQRTWLSRCGGVVTFESADPEEWIGKLNAKWKEILASRPATDEISYRNNMGIPGCRTLGQIARHVINHGTYHRGQLREIAEYLNLANIPGTDLVGFHMLQDA